MGGSTANSSACGWRGDTHLDAQNSTNVTLNSAWWPWYGGDDRRRRGGSWNGGGSGGWHIHAGWHTSTAAGGASLLLIDFVENFAQNLKYSEVSVLHSGKRPRTNIVSLLYACTGSYLPLSKYSNT